MSSNYVIRTTPLPWTVGQRVTSGSLCFEVLDARYGACTADGRYYLVSYRSGWLYTYVAGRFLPIRYLELDPLGE